MKVKYLTLILAIVTCLLSNRALSDVSRPNEGVGPTEVRMFVFVADLDDVDTANQNFTANVFMVARWHDERLAHNRAGEVVYPLADVWHPRLQWINQQKVWETFPQMVEVSPEGEVVYVQRVWGQFSQPLTLWNFPFDEQEFDVTLLAARHTPDEVRLVQDPERQSGIADADHLSVADWTVTSSKTMTGVYGPLREISPMNAFTFRFEATRGTRYFFLTIIIPLMLIVAMSWVVFWIDPKESGTQIGVAMTSMLTLIAYRFAVASHLPRISYMSLIDIFLLGATLLVFASLVEVMITSYLARSERLQLARRIDVLMRLVFPLALAGVFVLAFWRVL